MDSDTSSSPSSGKLKVSYHNNWFMIQMISLQVAVETSWEFKGKRLHFVFSCFFAMTKNHEIIRNLTFSITATHSLSPVLPPSNTMYSMIMPVFLLLTVTACNVWITVNTISTTQFIFAVKLYHHKLPTTIESNSKTTPTNAHNSVKHQWQALVYYELDILTFTQCSSWVAEICFLSQFTSKPLDSPIFLQYWCMLWRGQPWPLCYPSKVWPGARNYGLT